MIVVLVLALLAIVFGLTIALFAPSNPAAHTRRVRAKRDNARRADRRSARS